jgi:hypothetical protein
MPFYSEELPITENKGFAWKIFDLSKKRILRATFEITKYETTNGKVMWNHRCGGEEYGFCMMAKKLEAIKVLKDLRKRAPSLKLILKKIEYSNPVSLHIVPFDWPIFGLKAVLLAREFKLTSKKQYVRL